MLLAALAAILVLALSASSREQGTPAASKGGKGKSPAAGAPAAGKELSKWPEKWEATPSAEQIREAEAAAKEYSVPLLLLFALGYIESRFDANAKGKLHGGNSERFKNSYELYRNRKIGGSKIRWGSKFKASDWRPYGWLQVLPLSLWGDGGVLPASAPLEAGLDVRANVRAAANFLRRAYKSGGSWLAAVKAYNAKPTFTNMVIKEFSALGGKVSELSETRS